MRITSLIIGLCCLSQLAQAEGYLDFAGKYVVDTEKGPLDLLRPFRKDTDIRYRDLEGDPKGMRYELQLDVPIEVPHLEPSGRVNPNVLDRQIKTVTFLVYLDEDGIGNDVFDDNYLLIRVGDTFIKFTEDFENIALERGGEPYNTQSNKLFEGPCAFFHRIFDDSLLPVVTFGVRLTSCDYDKVEHLELSLTDSGVPLTIRSTLDKNSLQFIDHKKIAPLHTIEIPGWKLEFTIIADMKQSDQYQLRLTSLTRVIPSTVSLVVKPH